MTRTWRSRSALVLALAACALAPRAAQAETTVRATADTDLVEVGDELHVTLRAESDEGDPTGADLGPHGGFAAQGPALGRSQSISILNGRRSDTIGLTATWTLRAQRTGTFVVGPSSVATASGRKHAAALSVRVVGKGQAPPRPRRLDPHGSNDPFDPFGGGFPFPNLRPPGGAGTDPFRGLFDEEAQDDAADSVPAELRLPHARAEGAFLHAQVDRTRAVVGEQVTYGVYLYVDRTAPDPELADVHEADAPDFLKRSLLADETHLVPVGHVRLDGRVWDVKLVRKSALFPLKTGALPIQPMRLSVSRRRGAAGLRESELVTVEVVEPPVAGRPPRYVVGDVGAFQLRADVAPRETDQGGSVGVELELSGTGNLPEKLPLPTRPGVVWLEPEVRANVGPDGRGRFAGSRRFRYVVRLDRAGTQELGAVELPFYDPAKRAYATAQAALGAVTVRAVDGGVPGAGETEANVLATLPGPRTALAGVRPKDPAFLDRPAFRALLAGLPLLGLATLAGARLRERRRALGPRQKVQRAGDALGAARTLSASDPRAALRELGRALEAGVRERTGLELRGLAPHERRGALVAGGVPDEAARALDEALAEVEASRFAPTPPEPATALALVAAVEHALAALPRRTS